MGLFKKIFRKLYQDSTPADGPYQYDKQSHGFADTLFQINVIDAVELLMILDHYTPPPHLQDVDYEDQAADMLAEALRGDTGAQRILTDLIVRACGLLPTPYTGELTIRQLMHQALSGDLQSQKKVAAIIQPLAIPELEPEEGYILEIGLDSGQTRQEWRASALLSNLSSRIEKHQNSRFAQIESGFEHCGKLSAWPRN